METAGSVVLSAVFVCLKDKINRTNIRFAIE